LAVLEATAQSLQAGNCNCEQQKQALASIHKLVGGLGTFGYDTAAAIAETLEASLMQHLEQEAQWASRFADMLGELRQELSQAAASAAVESPDTGSRQDK
jgi:HPt (histidine-containing phosphotransfer) domain-containing protein